jgi:flagellar export protein FliJ
MKRPLGRLLRLREILEDLSRLSFEEKNAAMRDLEGACRRQRQTALSMRADALRTLTMPEPTAPEAWSMRRADAGIAAWKEAKLDALVEAGKPAIDRVRDVLLARRMERLQVEMLQAAAERAEKKAQARREQNRTDDWFGSLPARGTRTRG